jgi:hypothetical protein
MMHPEDWEVWLQDLLKIFLLNSPINHGTIRIRQRAGNFVKVFYASNFIFDDESGELLYIMFACRPTIATPS